MVHSIHFFWNRIGRRKCFWIPVLFFTISTYGYSIFSRTISIDDLASDVYVGSGQVMIAADRWGMNVTSFLDAIPRVSPASDRLLATCFLLVAAFLLPCSFYHVHHEEGNNLFVYKYTVLSCSLITYPIIGEIWEYSGANYLTTGGMLLSIVTCYYLDTRKTYGIKELLAAGIIMTLPMSSYESGVLFYVTLVCAVLMYQYCLWGDQNGARIYWKKTLLYASPLFIAFALRKIIGFSLRMALGVAKGSNGATVIQWGNAPFSEVLRKTVIDSFLNYIVNGIVYLPITIFLISAFFIIGLIIYRTIKQKNLMIMVAGVVLLCSVFILPLIQGAFMQYRTAISLSAFVSYSMFCLIECFERHRKVIKVIAIGLVIYLIWVQSEYLNSELALNTQRSENEMRFMSGIAQNILKTDTEKPVIFVGEYDIGDYFREAKTDYSDSVRGQLYQRAIQALKNRYGDYYYTYFHITEFPDSNVNSVINYSLAVDGMMEKYLSYLGYDIQVIDRMSNPNIFSCAKEIVDSKQMYPYDVTETDDFIIATLKLQ